MKCPYCGGEMAEGYVTGGMNNRDGAYWRPKTRGVREWFTRRYGEAVTLSQMGCDKAEAWYCRKCGKIIIEAPVQEE